MTRTAFDQSEPEDIVEMLMKAHNDIPFSGDWNDGFLSLYLLAAEEIIKLRKILGITEN